MFYGVTGWDVVEDKDVTALVHHDFCWERFSFCFRRDQLFKTLSLFPVSLFRIFIISHYILFENLLSVIFTIRVLTSKVEKKFDCLRRGEAALLTVELLFFGKKWRRFHTKKRKIVEFLIYRTDSLWYNRNTEDNENCMCHNMVKTKP